ncbi:MAG TPA: nitroreductase family protein [Bacteroidales bacterium]|jgi:nitroreductase|nr:nitroreductase family protein [Bacteroidales bacterium]
MEFTELIRNRESIRNYDPDRPVPKEILERILEAGRLAPTACNIQPFRFLVVSSSAMLEKVRACYHREWFKEAPHILIIVGYRDKAWKRGNDGYNSIETDMTIALDHLILAAENEGIGTCWIANYNPEILKKALNLGKDQVVFSITPLGYQKPGFKKSADKKRKQLKDIVEYL